MRAVFDHGRPLVDEPARLAGVGALGLVETAFLRANRYRRTSYLSGLVDTATGRLLDVVPDRTARAVSGWLTRQDAAWLAPSAKRCVHGPCTLIDAILRRLMLPLRRRRYRFVGERV